METKLNKEQLEAYNRAIADRNRLNDRFEISNAINCLRESPPCSFNCKHCEKLLDKEYEKVRKMKESYKRKWKEEYK